MILSSLEFEYKSRYLREQIFSPGSFRDFLTIILGTFPLAFPQQTVTLVSKIHAESRFASRLDRKSSRGMIYENEELRLRTININAEVERGR